MRVSAYSKKVVKVVNIPLANEAFFLTNIPREELSFPSVFSTLFFLSKKENGERLRYFFSIIIFLCDV